MLSALMSQVATEQPSAASWITSSRPIPVAPPVTTANRPSNESMISRLSSSTDNRPPSHYAWPATSSGGGPAGRLLVAEWRTGDELMSIETEAWYAVPAADGDSIVTASHSQAQTQVVTVWSFPSGDAPDHPGRAQRRGEPRRARPVG